MRVEPTGSLTPSPRLPVDLRGRDCTSIPRPPPIARPESEKGQAHAASTDPQPSLIARSPPPWRRPTLRRSRASRPLLPRPPGVLLELGQDGVLQRNAAQAGQLHQIQKHIRQLILPTQLVARAFGPLDMFHQLRDFDR